MTRRSSKIQGIQKVKYTDLLGEFELDGAYEFPRHDREKLCADLNSGQRKNAVRLLNTIQLISSILDPQLRSTK